MKRRIFLITILFFVGSAILFAQNFKNESELYPKTLQVHRVYPHVMGYRVDYVKEDYSVGTFWAPNEWFYGAGSYGDMVFGTGAAYPYVSFFYKNGVLDHFRLYLIEEPTHISWGFLKPQTDYSDKFPSEDSSLEIEY